MPKAQAKKPRANANKSKGSTYERKLVTLLEGIGLEAYRVPASGALGYNNAVRLPTDLKAQLVGDVVARFPATLTSTACYEVKYRAAAAGFVTLYNLVEKHGGSLEAPDCCVWVEEHAIDAYLNNPLGITLPKPILGKTLSAWGKEAEIIALKAARRQWLFVRKVNRQGGDNKR